MFGLAACAFVALWVRHHGRDRPLSLVPLAGAVGLCALGSALVAMPPADRFEVLVVYPIVLTAVALEWATAALNGWLT